MSLIGGPIKIGGPTDNDWKIRETNREGMTFAEWYAAAVAFRRTPLPRIKARMGWERGEDPTEYAGR